jgi:hypothetical protein
VPARAGIENRDARVEACGDDLARHRPSGAQPSRERFEASVSKRIVEQRDRVPGYLNVEHHQLAARRLTALDSGQDARFGEVAKQHFPCLAGLRVLA